MDPVQLDDARSGDHPSLVTSTTAAHGNATVHYDRDSHDHIHHSPHGADEGAKHGHVSLGHFDPSGVDELKRTMSRMSEERAPPLATASSRHSNATDNTLSSGDGPFDFEKALQRTVRQCVAAISPCSEFAHSAVQVRRV